MITVSILLDSVEKIQRFVSIISKYSCDFDIESGHSCIDAKSLVGLFSLDISKPLRLTINDDGTLSSSWNRRCFRRQPCMMG